MANLVYQKQESSVTWINTAGTHVLTLTSMANSAGRKGEVHDFGASHAGRVIIELATSFGTGPTSGNIVPIYWCSSRDNSLFDGNLSSADAAASDTDIHRNLHFVGNFICDNVTTVQRQSWLFYLPGRYGFPVVYNSSGQTMGSTAADHKLTITPYPDEIQ